MTKAKLNFQEQVLQQLDEYERVQFVLFYRQNYKKLGIAYLWLLFFGIFGMHQLYLNKRSGWLYLIFCWTLIPAFMAVIDVFLLPFKLQKYNRNLSISIFELIKNLNPSSLHLLLIERRLCAKRIKLFEWIMAFSIVFGVIMPTIAYASMRLTAHTLEIHYKANYLDGSHSDSYLIL